MSEQKENLTGVYAAIYKGLEAVANLRIADINVKHEGLEDGSLIGLGVSVNRDTLEEVDDVAEKPTKKKKRQSRA